MLTRLQADEIYPYRAETWDQQQDAVIAGYRAGIEAAAKVCVSLTKTVDGLRMIPDQLDCEAAIRALAQD